MFLILANFNLFEFSATILEKGLLKKIYVEIKERVLSINNKLRVCDKCGKIVTRILKSNVQRYIDK